MRGIRNTRIDCFDIDDSKINGSQTDYGQIDSAQTDSAQTDSGRLNDNSPLYRGSAVNRSAAGGLAALSVIAISVIAISLAGCGGGGGGIATSTTPVQIDDVTGTHAPANGNGDAGAGGDTFSRRDEFTAGTRTPGTNDDPVFYETDEYANGGSPAPLAVSQFSRAYARGWTGNGSLVTVADTGIDADHPDLAANIIANKDFTGSVLEDEHGHGTHVAGIVAAVRDGTGVHGGAFDAGLLIAKVARQRSYDFGLARSAAGWGRDLGSVAVNVSAAYGASSFLESRLVALDTGSYYLDYSTYGQEGFYNVTRTADAWREALGPSQVLVKAAGNFGTDYSAGLNQLATATDEDGSLMLNGQSLVVGNWDTAAQQIRGNQAGHVCTTWTGIECRDALPLSSRFVMAPGTSITSTYLNGQYAGMTGTSMAAPLVSSAIAILHQMWPHLSGRQLADIVFETADSSIPGYALHIHGQGLLDMEHATRPIGTVGVPQSTSVSGERAAVVGAASIAGAGVAARAMLAGVMVLDDYDRDFHVDLGGQLVSHDTRPVSAVEEGGIVDGYSAYLDPSRRAAVHFTPRTGLVLTVGAGQEEGSFLGNRVAGIFGEIDSSFTTYGLASLTHQTKGDGARLFAQLGSGATIIQTGDAPGLLNGATNVLSNTATIGVTTALAGGRIGVMLAAPVQIGDGNLVYDLPVARDLNGQVRFDQRHMALRPSRRETDLGLFFKRSWLNGALQSKTFVELRHDAPTAAAHGSRLQPHAGMEMTLTF
ncbi:MAG: S8 family serine peptidase [Alphaproteobacteria bacterium]|nr:S8 family serine peptidase [Alphaproteobacteria bacterium]